MTRHEFKVWLVTNGYTIKRLAARLQVTEVTIYNYQKQRFPELFVMALRGLEHE